MRTLPFAIAMLFVVPTIATAQSEKYMQAMQANITAIDSAKTVDEKLALSNTFERIAKTEKDQWQPYYYASMLQVLRTFEMTNKSTVDAELDRADDLLARAEILSPNNSELLCLKSMVCTSRMMVEPQTRGEQYGRKSTEALEQAIKADGTNPRAYLLLAQAKFFTPAFWGGGKDKAKPLAEKSVELFATFTPATSIDPIWGKSMAEGLLKQCE